MSEEMPYDGGITVIRSFVNSHGGMVHYPPLFKPRNTGMLHVASVLSNFFPLSHCKTNQNSAHQLQIFSVFWQPKTCVLLRRTVSFVPVVMTIECYEVV